MAHPSRTTLRAAGAGAALMLVTGCGMDRTTAWPVAASGTDMVASAGTGGSGNLGRGTFPGSFDRVAYWGGDPPVPTWPHSGGKPSMTGP